MDTVTITEWLGTVDELAAVADLVCSENPKMMKVMIAAVSRTKGRRLVRLTSERGNVLAVVKEGLVSDAG